MGWKEYKDDLMAYPNGKDIVVHFLLGNFLVRKGAAKEHNLPVKDTRLKEIAAGEAVHGEALYQIYDTEHTRKFFSRLEEFEREVIWGIKEFRSKPFSYNEPYCFNIKIMKDYNENFHLVVMRSGYDLKIKGWVYASVPLNQSYGRPVLKTEDFKRLIDEVLA